MNQKYSEDMKEQTVAYALESGKSLTKVSKELGINLNTLCRWVQAYKDEHGIIDNSGKTASADKMQARIKELEKKLKEKGKTIAKQKKEIDDEILKVEILKNPCTSLRNPAH